MNLEKLYLFLAAHDKFAAKTAIQAIRKQALKLETFPNAGRAAGDTHPGNRELLIPYGKSGYVTLYRLEGCTVSILAVRHQKEAGY